MALLELRNVSKIYHLGGEEIRALDDVSLDLEQGEFVSIIGPSGSGKSTLMHILGCLDTPTRGNVTLAGTEIARASARELAKVRNRTIGFVFQFFNLLPTLTLAENVALPLLLAGSSPADAMRRARTLGDRVGLSARLDAYPAQVSGGEMQRAAIARAIVHEPALLVADEPTGNLDSGNGTRVLTLLQELNASLSLTILLATHAPDIAGAAHRTLQMRDGVFVPDAGPVTPARPARPA
jgi:putative ABC transport system ATP-binding protein